MLLTVWHTMAELQALLNAREFDRALALLESSSRVKAKKLARYGAPRKHTCLHVAVEAGAPIAIIELLLQHVEADARNEHGRSPVYLAARHNASIPVMDLLVRSAGGGACLATRDTYSFTPLMASCFRRASVNLVGRLVYHGANIAETDSSNRTGAVWARTVNGELLPGHVDNGEAIACYLDAFPAVWVLASACTVRRLRKTTCKLGMLPMDLVRLVRNALVVVA